MVRQALLILCLLALLPSRLLAQESDPPPPKDVKVFDEARRRAEFAGHVAEGDRERRAGRPGAAANHYADALKVFRDPVIGGRLGVLLVELGHFSSRSYEPASFVFLKPGAGARAGFSWNPAKSFVLRGSLDIMGLSSGIKVRVGQTVIAEHPPLLLGAQVIGGWEF